MPEGGVSQGGELREENRQLIFEPHSFEKALGRRIVDIPVSDIVSVERVKSPMSVRRLLPLPAAVNWILFIVALPLALPIMMLAKRKDWIRVDTNDGRSYLFTTGLSNGDVDKSVGEISALIAKS